MLFYVNGEDLKSFPPFFASRQSQPGNFDCGYSDVSNSDFKLDKQ